FHFSLPLSHLTLISHNEPSLRPRRQHRRRSRGADGQPGAQPEGLGCAVLRRLQDRRGPEGARRHGAQPRQAGGLLRRRLSAHPSW
ncbi:hypothetical protein FA09DRAFT_357864, partial [Tilletiopsis washingtonensis]